MPGTLHQPIADPITTYRPLGMLIDSQSSNRRMVLEPINQSGGSIGANRPMRVADCSRPDQSYGWLVVCMSNEVLVGTTVLCHKNQNFKHCWLIVGLVGSLPRHRGTCRRHYAHINPINRSNEGQNAELKKCLSRGKHRIRRPRAISGGVAPHKKNQYWSGASQLDASRPP